MNPNMSPIDWAKRPLEKYADFSGRAPRAEYWWFVLGVIVVFVILTVIESIVGINRMILGVYGPLTVLLWLAIIVPSIAVGVRRLHDTNRTGWWLLVPFVPYIIGMALGGATMFRAASGGAASQTAAMAGLGLAGIFLFVGGVLWIVLLVFYCLAGTPGDNRYGPNPYGADVAA